jgi:putative oxidoreductase
MSKIAAIVGRLLIGILFILSGIGKLMDIGAAAAYMGSHGLPPSFALPIGVFELVAGLCLAAGFAVRLVSVLLAVFTAGTILFAHNRFTDPAQAMEALKNLAIIGGLALAFAHSQMWSHYYTMRTVRRGEVATRDAEQRVHEAEIRAARAEAAAEAIRTGAAAPTYADTNHDGVADTRVGRRRWFDW